MLDLALAFLASYVQSALEWASGVAPWVGAFGACGVALAVFVAILSGAKLRQDRRVIEILERGAKHQAKPQGEGEFWSI